MYLGIPALALGLLCWAFHARCLLCSSEMDETSVVEVDKR